MFAANVAWLLLAALAHNLICWVAALGLGIDGPIVAKTLRRRFITLPGMITHRSRRRILSPVGSASRTRKLQSWHQIWWFGVVSPEEARRRGPDHDVEDFQVRAGVAKELQFPAIQTHTVDIDADRELHAVILDVKRRIWPYF